MSWQDEQAPKCPLCREVYGRREPPEDPPCFTCRVELREENIDLSRAYMLCRGQVITAGMGQVIDINLQAVKVILDEIGTGNKLEAMERIRKVFFHFLAQGMDRSK